MGSSSGKKRVGGMGQTRLFNRAFNVCLATRSLVDLIRWACRWKIGDRDRELVSELADSPVWLKMCCLKNSKTMKGDMETGSHLAR